MITGADASTAASTRPSLQADAFGSLVDTGFPIRVMAETADGWWGFDPGVAQAANTGVFRNRWVQASQVQVEGDCAAVPVVAGPMPGVCFTMPMADTPVYAGTETSSSVLITLVVDQYAAVWAPRAMDGLRWISARATAAAHKLAGSPAIRSISTAHVKIYRP